MPDQLVTAGLELWKRPYGAANLLVTTAIPIEATSQFVLF